jgi:hypothetical protein
MMKGAANGEEQRQDTSIAINNNDDDDSTNNPDDIPDDVPDDDERPAREAVLTWKEWAQQHRIVLRAAAKAAILFVACFVVLIVALKLLLPPIDPQDRPAVKIPKSFDDLKRLNQVLQVYKERHGARVLGSFILLYLLYGRVTAEITKHHTSDSLFSQSPSI